MMIMKLTFSVPGRKGNTKKARNQVITGGEGVKFVPVSYFSHSSLCLHSILYSVLSLLLMFE